MSSKTWLAGLSMLMLSLGVAAQSAEDDDDTVSPERLAMALDRSALAESYGAPAGEYFGYHNPYDFGQRYQATGYARARRSAYHNMAMPYATGTGYWNAPHHNTVWFASRRRTFGRRGELFLMAPTFLAPVMPFNEHSFEH